MTDRLIIIRSFKGLFRVLLILCILLSILNFGVLIGRYNSRDKSIGEFITTKIEYKWKTTDAPPIDLKNQIADYNLVVTDIWLALGCAFIVMFLDYFIDKPNHFITKIIDYLKNMEDKDV